MPCSTRQKLSENARKSCKGDRSVPWNPAKRLDRPGLLILQEPFQVKRYCCAFPSQRQPHVVERSHPAASVPSTIGGGRGSAAMFDLQRRTSRTPMKQITGSFFWLRWRRPLVLDAAFAADVEKMPCATSAAGVSVVYSLA